MKNVPEISTQQKLDDAQNEYFTLLFDMINMKEGLITEGKEYTYWWEKLKDKQTDIIFLADRRRYEALENAKKALDEAFTPHIRELLKSDADV